MRNGLHIGRLTCLLLAALVTTNLEAHGQDFCSSPGSLEEVLRIGSFDGPDALTRFNSIALGPSGEVYVPQPMSGVIMIFGPDGALLDSFGQDGSGPGDFDFGPRSVRWVDGKLWVGDRTRLQSFSSSRRPEDFITFRYFEPHEGVYFRPDAPLADGSIMTRQSVTPAQDPITSLPVRRFDREGRVIDTVAVLDVAGDRVIVDQTGGFTMHPLAELLPGTAASRLHLSVSADRSEFVLLGEVSHEAKRPFFDLLRISIEGDTLLRRRLPFERMPITRADQEWWLDAFSSVLAGDYSAGDSRSPQMSEERSNRERRRARESLELPDHYPPVRQVIAGSDRTIWVLREGRPPDFVNRWEVFDSEGRLLGRLVDRSGTDPFKPWLPKLAFLNVSRETVWAASRDELGVAYLHRFDVVDRC